MPTIKELESLLWTDYTTTQQSDRMASEVHAWLAKRWPTAQSSAHVVGDFAREVFRIAGGDVECCPNPTQEHALACLKDLRQCYEELLSVADMIPPTAAIESLSRQGGEAVGCLNIQRWRGIDSMVNHDFDYYGDLPDGTYQLYTAPTRASEAGDCPDWKGLLLALVTERPKRCRNHHGDAPGHSHSIPGVWDSDNGILAGKECAWCKAWREAETYLAIAAAPAPGGGPVNSNNQTRISDEN